MANFQQVTFLSTCVTLIRGILKIIYIFPATIVRFWVLISKFTCKVPSNIYIYIFSSPSLRVLTKFTSPDSLTLSEWKDIELFSALSMDSCNLNALLNLIMGVALYNVFYKHKCWNWESYNTNLNVWYLSYCWETQSLPLSHLLE